MFMHCTSSYLCSYTHCLVPMLYAEKREDWFIDGYGLSNSRISTFLWYSPHYIKILFKILLVDTLDIIEKTVLWALLIWDICVHIYGYCYGCGCACTLSHVPLCATPWTVNRQAPLSMGFLRQEYWSGLPFSSPRDLPDPGIFLTLLHCRQILYHLSHQGSPLLWVGVSNSDGYTGITGGNNVV